MSMIWDMGNGDISYNYHGETQYDTTGIYAVTLTAKVSRCTKEKTINIAVTMAQVVVSVNDTLMGTVTGGGNYPKNAIVTLNAIPNDGYSFIQWNDNNTANPRTITLTQDTLFQAIFTSTIGITDLKTSDVNISPVPG